MNKYTSLVNELRIIKELIKSEGYIISPDIIEEVAKTIENLTKNLTNLIDYVKEVYDKTADFDGKPDGLFGCNTRRERFARLNGLAIIYDYIDNVIKSYETEEFYE